MSAEPERRQRILQMAAGAVFLAVAAVLVLIVVNSSGSGTDAKIEGAAEVDRELAGIPQHSMVLGDPKAPVRLIEFGDLQCPICAGYAKEILPPIIESQVKNGEAALEFRNLTIIGEESIPAGAAALAAGEQGRGWNYLELFYRNQGEENSGYVTDEFMRAVANAAGVKNLAKWKQDRQELTGKVEQTTAEGKELGYDATPSFAVEGPATKGGLRLLGTPETTGALEEALEAAR